MQKREEGEIWTYLVTRQPKSEDYFIIKLSKNYSRQINSKIILNSIAMR